MVASDKNHLKKKQVLMIYTGGTIGMVHPNNDPNQPLKNVSWGDLEKYIPILGQLPITLTPVSFETPIDSAEMRPEHWIRIADIVQRNYDSFDGFVILHGTDTLAYTASALSFLFENLSKPVVLTGSQLPLGKPRSDAQQNLVTSIMIAAAIDNAERDLPIVPEVCVFFRDVLLRGNRTRKCSTKDYSGFMSPNYPILGTAGEHIEINEKVILQPSPHQFYVDQRINKNVISFNIFPGTSVEVLGSIFGVRGLKGVVLNTYGAGNAPTDPNFLSIINQAINEHGIVVVNVTQCPQGEVEMGLYETSAKMMDQGVVSGLDMSPEAALAKLSVLLGRGFSPKDVGQYMQIDQRGEMSKSIYTIDFGAACTDDKGTFCSEQKEIVGAAKLCQDKVVHSMLRVFSVETSDPTSQLPFSVRAYINLASADRTTPDTLPQFAGSEEVKPQETPKNLLFPVTKTARSVLSQGIPVCVNIVTDKEKVSWRRLTLSVYTKT